MAGATVTWRTSAWSSSEVINWSVIYAGFRAWQMSSDRDQRWRVWLGAGARSCVLLEWVCTWQAEALTAFGNSPLHRHVIITSPAETDPNSIAAPSLLRFRCIVFSFFHWRKKQLKGFSKELLPIWSTPMVNIFLPRSQMAPKKDYPIAFFYCYRLVLITQNKKGLFFRK